VLVVLVTLVSSVLHVFAVLDLVPQDVAVLPPYFLSVVVQLHAHQGVQTFLDLSGLLLSQQAVVLPLSLRLDYLGLIVMRNRLHLSSSTFQAI